MLGRKIKIYRLQQGLTKKELAAKVGITPAMITAFEDNKQTPNLRIIRSLMSVLNVSFGSLLSNIPPRPSSKWKSARSYSERLKEEYLDKLYFLSILLDDREVADKTATEQSDALLERLVMRALDEDKISLSRAGELLGITPFEVREKQN